MNIARIGDDFNGSHVTMSSREIADLCDKRHDHVLRDIEKMIQDIDHPKFGVVDFEARYQDAKGEWRKEYRLPKDLTVTLITGYRADLRFKVIKRLEELETQNRTSIPDLSDPVVLLQLLTDHASKRIEAEQRAAQAETKAIAAEEKAEGFATKAMALDLLDTAEGNLTVRPASKVLDRPEHRFVQWMQQNRWAFRQGGRGPLQAYSDKIAAGLLAHKLGRYTDQHTGEEKTSITLVITPKGMSRLAQIFAQEDGAKK